MTTVPEQHWYIIHVAAGHENRVASELQAQCEKARLTSLMTEIRVPKRQTTVIKRGVKVQVEDRILPGYILVKMVCVPETLHIIRRIPKVIGMLGSDASGIPRILAESEVERFLEQLNRMADSSRMQLSFEPGEVVKVSEGLFSSMEGVVEEVDMERSRLKVSIAILGRSTPVDLEFSQVEKMS